MIVLRTLLFVVVIALSTMLVGWWTLPILGALHAVVRRAPTAPLESAIAAFVAWGALLARYATAPAFAKLLGVLGGIFPVSGVAMLLVTVVFAALLAWSGARVVNGFVSEKKVAT